MDDVSLDVVDLSDNPTTTPLPTTSAELAASLDGYGDDIAGWLNDLLDGPSANNDGAELDPLSSSDLRDLDKRIQHLSTKLDIAAQDTSSQLETTIDDISRTVPRLTYDLQFLRESALSLQQSLVSIEHRRGPQEAVKNIPATPDASSTVHALERLHYLDTVKTAMERTFAVLREAESWSSLDSEITSLISTQAYGAAATRLSEASRSLALFSNTPEYETRRALMISLQNQLEAALSSALVAAINKLDIATCKTYYTIFTDIQREVEFRNYYFGSRRKRIVELWSNAKLLDCEGELASATIQGSGPQDQESTNLVTLLKVFFSEFHSLLSEERGHVTSIFPDPQQTLSSFVQTTIDSLNPPLAQRLSSMADHYGAVALTHLIKAFKVAEEFAVMTDKLMEGVGYSASLSPLNTSPDNPFSEGAGGGGGLKRRHSKRMSLSRRLGPGRSASISGPQGLGGPVGGTGAWEQALFEPFIDFQSEYITLEKKYLDEGLKGVVSNSSKGKGDGTLVDGARVLRERSAAVFDMAEETLERCMVFTHGFGAVGLLQSVDHAFSTLLDVCQSQFLAPSNLSSFKNPDGSVSNPSSDEVDGFEELDYSSEDWAAFQEALHLLETCKAMRDRLRTLELKIKMVLVQFSGMVHLSRVDPNALFISGTTKGEVQLLSQSTLNSADLQTLLESLLRDSQSYPAVTTPSPAPGRPQADIILLKGARSAVTSFTQATQLFLQNIILAPLHRQLAGYATSPWTSQRTTASGRGATGSAAYELQMPTFSLSHTQTIQLVSDGLLNLPRLFEVHADDDALAFSLETLPFVDSASLEALLSGVPPGESVPVSPSPKLRRLSSGSSSASLATTMAQKPAPPVVLTPEMVSSTWLSSLTLSLLSHLTINVLPSIRYLSPDGAAQLASDLGYLSNIVRALNVEWEELERWRTYSDLKDDDGKRKCRQTTSEEADNVFKAIAKIRGWVE